MNDTAPTALAAAEAYVTSLNLPWITTEVLESQYGRWLELSSEVDSESVYHVDPTDDVDDAIAETKAAIATLTAAREEYLAGRRVRVSVVYHYEEEEESTSLLSTEVPVTTWMGLSVGDANGNNFREGEIPGWQDFESADDIDSIEDAIRPILATWGYGLGDGLGSSGEGLMNDGSRANDILWGVVDLPPADV